MQFVGEYRIPASRPQVWRALNDPDILKACIDGCEELVWVADERLKATVRAKIGPVHARFRGNIVLTDVRPGESYVLNGEGKGGIAGFARGQALIRLRDDGPETVMHYEATASLGGRIGTIGARLAKGTADRLADTFFENFTERLLVAMQAAEEHRLAEAEEAVHKHAEFEVGPVDDTEAVAAAARAQGLDVDRPEPPQETETGAPAEDDGAATAPATAPRGAQGGVARPRSPGGPDLAGEPDRKPGTGALVEPVVAAHPPEDHAAGPEPPIEEERAAVEARPPGSMGADLRSPRHEEETGRYLRLSGGALVIMFGWGFALLVLVLLFLVR